MQVAMEHDQKIRGSKSPISITRKEKSGNPSMTARMKLANNRNSLRNSKEIQKEIELIRKENDLM